MSKVVSVRVSDDFFEILEELRKKTGFSKRDIIEYAISDYYLKYK